MLCEGSQNMAEILKKKITSLRKRGEYWLEAGVVDDGDIFLQMSIWARLNF